MPNWVTNHLTVFGTENEIQKVWEQVKGDKDFFDFNKILPMPKELDLCPSLQEEKCALGEEIGNRKYISQEMVETLKENIKNHGFMTWHDWSRANWGTKWNACHALEPKENKIKFDTAWSTPEGIWYKLSSLFPECVFFIEYADEDIGRNCGKITFQKGYLIRGEWPLPYSEEATSLAERLFDLKKEHE